MSDEETQQGPTPSAAWLAEHRKRITNEARSAEEVRERDETEQLLDDIRILAASRIQQFEQVRCRGLLEFANLCSDENETVCELRELASCPRVIRRYDRAMERRALEERLGDSGIPGDLLATVLGEMDPTDATMTVDEWLPTEQKLLLLAGGVGVGKSVAAAYAIRRASGRWLSAGDIAHVASLSSADKLAELRRARLLVIDDVGAEYADKSDWAKTALRTLVCQRFDEGKRTLLTTNLSAAQWKAYVDERLRDRLAGSGTVKTIGGLSMRRKP